jgi:hypothetical protein
MTVLSLTFVNKCWNQYCAFSSMLWVSFCRDVISRGRKARLHRLQKYFGVQAEYEGSMREVQWEYKVWNPLVLHSYFLLLLCQRKCEGTTSKVSTSEVSSCVIYIFSSPFLPFLFNYKFFLSLVGCFSWCIYNFIFLSYFLYKI